MSADMKTVGKRLKELRKEVGLSQQHVADYLRVDQSLITKYESGQRSISADRLEALASLFCISVKDMLSAEPAGNPVSFAFRTNELQPEDLEALSHIHTIVLNQMEMDEL